MAVESIAKELNRELIKHFYGSRAEKILMAVFEAYEGAQDLIDKYFLGPEAHDLRSHIRRGFIEQGLRTQMTGLPNVIATSEKVTGGTQSFTKVKFDDRLILTVSHSESVGSLPREAVYRKGYAQLQFDLFLKAAAKDASGERYALITHGPSYSRAVGTLPMAFCQIGFPDANYTTFVHRVDLMRCYAPLFRKLVAHETITIGEATAELLENIAREKKSS